MSKPMLKEARRKIQKDKLENVKLRYADAANTGFPNASFDFIIMGLILHECKKELIY